MAKSQLNTIYKASASPLEPFLFPKKGCANLKIMHKRLLSLLLVFILTLGMFPTAMAATVEEDPDLPAPIEGYDPNAPDNPYPYGLPVTEYIPEDVQNIIDYGVSMMADDNQGNIPDEMWDNAILRALEYTGYDVQRQKDKGQLYQYLYIGSRLPNNDSAVLSDISYWSSGACPNGDETVADSTTVTGKAPKISYFESNGLVCASFATYFLCNYLPNIEGVDTSVVYEKAKEMGMDSSTNHYYLTTVSLWKRTLDALSKEANAGVTKYTDEDTAYDNLVPGDVVIFGKSDGTLTHVAIYAGEYYLYNGSTNLGLYHYMIHVGNSRGPEISIIEWMSTSTGSKASDPVAFYHLDFNDTTEPMGYIEVNKDDEAGKALPGAYFTATDNATGTNYIIGPTDTNGYAKSEALPLSTYTVVESVFPEGYQASGQTTWTVTLTEDTPNLTVTVNAVNELITGDLGLEKDTEDGKNKGGWQFGIYAEQACTTLIAGPVESDSNGKLTVTGLVPGTVWVKELGHKDAAINDLYYCETTNPQQVTIVGNKTATVSFYNRVKYGSLTFRKATTSGLGAELGWTANLWRVETDGTWTFIGSGTTKQDAADPTYTFENLLPGRYVLQEDASTAHPGFNVDTEYYYIDVSANQNADVTITNEHLGKAQIVKDMPDGGSGAGWEFEMYRVGDNAFIGTFVTTEDSTVLTDYIEPGEYLIYEKIPDGSIYYCESANPQTVTVVAGETAVVTFTNRIRPGSIEAQKVDTTDTPRAGAEFLLEWSEDGENWAPVVYADSPYVVKGYCTSAGLTDGKLVSGEDGMVRFEGLHPELYYRLTETKAPDGLQLLADYAFVGQLPIERELTVSLKVVNAPAFTLPKTGSNTAFLLPVSLVVCLAACVGALVYLRRKEQ